MFSLAHCVTPFVWSLRRMKYEGIIMGYCAQLTALPSAVIYCDVLTFAWCAISCASYVKTPLANMDVGETFSRGECKPIALKSCSQLQTHPTCYRNLIVFSLILFRWTPTVTCRLAPRCPRTGATWSCPSVCPSSHRSCPTSTLASPVTSSTGQ